MRTGGPAAAGGVRESLPASVPQRARAAPRGWFTLHLLGQSLISWSNGAAGALILRPFRWPLVTWIASSSPRWTLLQHGLAGAAESARGLVQRHVAVGHLGHEPGADLVGQPDPPRRAGCRLLGGQQAGVDPAADGLHRDAELARRRARCSAARLCGVGWRGGGDAGTPAHAAHASLGERQAGAGAGGLGG